MLLLKKLCKMRQEQGRERCNHGNNINKNGNRSLVEVASSTTQTNKIATVNCINIANGKHLINERSLRSLPSTPAITTSPSSSTLLGNNALVITSTSESCSSHTNNNGINKIHLQQQRQKRNEFRQVSAIKLGQAPEVFAFKQPKRQVSKTKKANIILAKRNDLGLIEQRRKQSFVIDKKRRGLVHQNVATEPFMGQCQKQQYINRDKRRFRLHQLQSRQLQKQRLPTVSFNANLNEKSSGDCSNSSDVSDISDTSGEEEYNDHDGLIHSTNSLFKDARRPDLLNACSLVLQEQQTSDNSSIYSSINTYERLNCHQYEKVNKIPRISAEKVNVERTACKSTTLDTKASLNGNYNNCCNINYCDGIKNNKYGKSNQRLIQKIDEMGQSLSLRRPRISLTWILREQQPQQEAQKQEEEGQQQAKDEISSKETLDDYDNKNDIAQLTPAVSTTAIDTSKIPSVNNNENDEVKKASSAVTITNLMNGYATTPATHATTNDINVLLTHKFFSNKNLLQYHREEMYTKPASKDLFFVCTPQRIPESLSTSTDALAFAKKRHEIRKKLAMKKANLRSDSYPSKLMINSTKIMANTVQEGQHFSLSGSVLKTGSYSEPSLIAASEGNPRRHRHRKRRERNRSQKFGYDIRNVEEFLTKCSLLMPANIPMVLSSSCILYQTRPGGYQTEVALPLGMVVNAIFKNQIWLYVQTPHSEEGYVSYNCCLPLGILPPEARGQGVGSAKPPPCWESNGDIFPRPCGNMTDTEKEVHFIGSARSEGARTPLLKPLPPLKIADNVYTVISQSDKNSAPLNGNVIHCGEHHVDKLYLKAASQPKVSESKLAYAQLKILKNGPNHSQSTATSVNDEYVTLYRQQPQQQQQSQIELQQQHSKHKSAAYNQKSVNHKAPTIDRTFLTNGHNGQHLHPKDMNIIKTTTTLTTTPIAAITSKTIPKIMTAISFNSVALASRAEMTLAQQQQGNRKFNVHNNYHQPHQHHHHHYHHHPEEEQQEQQQQFLEQHTKQILTQNFNQYDYGQHQHHHPNPIHHENGNNQQQQQQHNYPYSHGNVLNALRRSTTHCGQRQTLVAITINYTTADGVHLRKGDIVTLCECRESNDQRQWFYVRTRDGRQGYIPAEVAGHGYL